MNSLPWYQRVLQPVLSLLRQGVAPEQLALGIVAGVMLGVFPVLGSTTLLCTAAAIVFRLNLPAVQLVNHAVYPLQLGLLIPFIRLGEKLFRAPRMPLSLSQIFSRIHQNAWQAIQDLWGTTLHAIMAWAVVMIPVALLLYFSLLPSLRRLLRSQSLPGKQETHAEANR